MAFKTVIEIIAVAIAAFYIVAPLFIYRSQRLPARVKFSDAGGGESPSEQSEAYRGLENQIKALGFDFIGASALSDTHNLTRFSLYSHNDDGTAAMLVTMENAVRNFTYAEFSQLYADGTMLDVSNSPQFPVYPRMPLKIDVRFPDIQELGELYDILLKLKSSLNNSSAPVAYRREHGFAEVEAFLAREADELVKRGYCKAAVDDEGKRGLTLKGAYIFTWKSLFPIKSICDAMDKAYSRKMLSNA